MFLDNEIIVFIFTLVLIILSKIVLRFVAYTIHMPVGTGKIALFCLLGILYEHMKDQLRKANERQTVWFNSGHYV